MSLLQYALHYGADRCFGMETPSLLLAVLGHPELFLRGQGPSSSSHILRLGIWSVPGKTEQGTRCSMKTQCFPVYSDKLLQVEIAETKANCSLQLSAYS